jgi:hypothetical protein
MDPFTIALLAQGGIAAGQAIAGTAQKKRAQREREAARGALGETRYADYNQAYYEELQRRAQVGLPEEQRQYMEQQAERAAGVGLAASEDRRAGLMGIGRAQAGLAQSYTTIGLADVASREQAAQAALGEMGQRGAQTYQEQMQLAQLDLATAEQKRQEALSMQQAGLQGLMSTGGQAAVGFSGGGTLQDLYGTGTAGAGAANQFSNYTPPQNLSLAQNNSPFAYGTGLNYTPGMSGIGLNSGQYSTGLNYTPGMSGIGLNFGQ